MGVSSRIPPLPVRPRFWMLRSSFVLVNLGMLLVLLMWVGQFETESKPRGLHVRPLRPGLQATNLDPLLIRVRTGGRLYVNSQLLAWEQLGPLLDRGLLRRPPEWPVYVQGDRDLEWGEVLRAVDVIRGKQAQVVLLTAEPAGTASDAAPLRSRL